MRECPGNGTGEGQGGRGPGIGHGGGNAGVVRASDRARQRGSVQNFGHSGDNAGVSRTSDTTKAMRQCPEHRTRRRHCTSFRNIGNGGDNAGVSRTSETVEAMQERPGLPKRQRAMLDCPEHGPQREYPENGTQRGSCRNVPHVRHKNGARRSSTRPVFFEENAVPPYSAASA